MRPLWLLAMLAVQTAATEAAPRLEPDASLVWRETGAEFGGFSGLAVLDGGTRMITVSDKGTYATATLTREAGRLTGVTRTTAGPLLGIAGAPLGGYDVDAEGVAVDDRGRIYISFEAFHRVRRHDAIDGPATDVPAHPAFAGLQNNSGLEALAIDADGVLYAIPERSSGPGRPFPVFRLRDGRWDTGLELPRTGAFLVAGADFGPDGALYLLERDFGWLTGFATRVRRFGLTPAGFAAGETLLETAFGTLDNMEGISVWRDASGAIRVTLISDDNFFPLQQTVIAEYLLRDD